MRYILFVIILISSSIIHASEVSGYVGLEGRYFTEYEKAQLSVYFEPEFYWESSTGSDSFILRGFSRLDDTDDERTHADLRELMWVHVANSWELHTGVGKVFWGVTESAHLVDIINQTDAVESFDGEDKLGQPMIQWSGIYDWGVIDGFVLPFFRERNYPSSLSDGIPIEISSALYESKSENKHVDVALRYSNSYGAWDVGVAYFDGTNRDPYLLYQENESGGYLQPYYTQIQQVSLDAQVTMDSFLWKLEAIGRSDSVKNFAAVTAGFEYTVVGVAESSMDLGLLAELHKDSRKEYAPTATQNDLFVGCRLAVNDMQDTSILMGVSQDLDNGSSYLAIVEASRRLGDVWRLTVDGLLAHSNNIVDPIYQLKDNDHLRVSIEYYF